MIRFTLFTLSAWSAALVCSVAVGQTTPESPVQTAPSPPVQSAPSPNAPIGPNTTPRSSDIIAQEAMPKCRLESPGLITGRIPIADARPSVPTPLTNVPTTPAQTTTVETVVEQTTATVTPVEKRWLMVPPMILDMMMSDTVTLGDGSTIMINRGPVMGSGYGLPYLPVDEIAVLPKMCVSVCDCLQVALPEACTLETEQQLKAVMMIGGHVEMVDLALTEPCLATITLPKMQLSGELRLTMLIGLNTGNILYEQPVVLTPVAQ